MKQFDHFIGERRDILRIAAQVEEKQAKVGCRCVLPCRHQVWPGGAKELVGIQVATAGVQTSVGTSALLVRLVSLTSC